MLKQHRQLQPLEHYPGGMLMPNRSYSSDKYRFGFNGKENDNEVKGTGNSQDYGMRIYDPRIIRFNSVDPIAGKFPMLTPYQFSSNNPIWNIDLDGLEGVQYLETTHFSDGSTIIQRVVELDVYVATTKIPGSDQYQQSDVKAIESNLNSEYNNKGFKDASGNEVVFRFNIQQFDADKVSPQEFKKKLERNPDNFDRSVNGLVTALKGTVLERGKIKSSEQGESSRSHVVISPDAVNPSHTQAHEIAHQFLNYDTKNNPCSVSKHDKAGGIFIYRHVDEDGNTTQNTSNVNQGNVDAFLKALPEVKSKDVY